jgi:hypothetical protein
VKRPNCPHCGQPCAVPEDFDNSGPFRWYPWCQNPDCTHFNEAVKAPERED